MTHQKPCLGCGQTIIKPQNESLKNWETRHKYCSRRCLGLVHTSVVGAKSRFKKGQKALHPILPGQHLSPQTEKKKGDVPWNKGTKGLMPTPWNKGQEWPENQGEKHYNWRGGRTELRIAIRQLFKYKQWRIAVFQRDNYTCQFCGDRRGPGNRVVINADHIKPFYKIMEENNITSLEEAKSCEELWDIENGRTLCVPCHKKTPTYLVNQYTK